MSQDKIRQILNHVSSNGKIFSVEFEKKDKTIRKMVCRKDVRKHLKGGATTYNPAVNMGVFDMEIGEYRSFAYDRVIKVNGKTIADWSLDSIQTQEA